MLKFLGKSYPFNNNSKHNIKIILGIGIGMLLFLIFFQPFDFENLDNTNKHFIYFGGSIITMLALFINLIIIPGLIPRLFLHGKWTIKKEIIWNLWILLSIGLSFLLYSKITGLFEINLFFIFKIILLSIIPVGVLITINQDRLLKIHLKNALDLNQKLLTQKTSKTEELPKQEICFTAENGKDQLTIKICDLLFIRSANNYIEVFWKHQSTIKKTLLRSTFIRAEDTSKAHERLFKCHRTYIVNLDNIKKVEGNSQGYKLYFDKIESFIPVSRSYIKLFKKAIR